MDEVCDDGRPHEAEEIENLPFYNHQLQKNTNSNLVLVDDRHLLFSKSPQLQD